MGAELHVQKPEFHSQKGWYFQRQDDGSVRIQWRTKRDRPTADELRQSPEPRWDLGMSVSGNRHYNAGAVPPVGWEIDEALNKIVRKDGAEHSDEVHATIILEPSSWASVVSSMSAAGENHETFTAALAFHAGEAQS